MNDDERLTELKELAETVMNELCNHLDPATNKIIVLAYDPTTKKVYWAFSQLAGEVRDVLASVWHSLVTKH